MPFYLLSIIIRLVVRCYYYVFSYFKFHAPAWIVWIFGPVFLHKSFSDIASGHYLGVLANVVVNGLPSVVSKILFFLGVSIWTFGADQTKVA